MKTKFTILTLLSMNVLFQVNAQTPLPYYTGFDNSAEKSGWDIYRKGDNSFYNWEYVNFTPVSSPTILQHDYPVGGTVATDDWFVSPSFNFTNGGKIDSLYFNFGGFGLPAAGDTVAVYLLQGNADPALASAKTLLLDYRTNYKNDNIWRDTFSINIPTSSGLSYIAFRYKTIDNWLDVHFDNLRLSGNNAASVKDINLYSQQIKLYPNPCHGNLKVEVPNEIRLKGKLSMELYTIPGQQIFQHEISNGSMLTMNVPSGIYWYKILDDGHIFQTSKLQVN